MTGYTMRGPAVHCIVCMTDAYENERQWEKYVELSHNSSDESSDSVSRSITHFSIQNRILLVSPNKSYSINSSHEFLG